MKWLLVLALVACGSVSQQADAERSARRWAEALGVTPDAVTCTCDITACFCDVRCGQIISPLYCSASNCTLRVR